MKADAGHVAVEQFLASAVGSGWASFRPQYITGPGSNKDCEEWFFDREPPTYNLPRQHSYSRVGNWDGHSKWIVPLPPL